MELLESFLENLGEHILAGIALAENMHNMVQLVEAGKLRV